MPNKTKAIVFMLISGFAFSLMSTMVKLSGDIPVSEKVFFRNFIGLFIAFYMIRKSKARTFGKMKNQKFLILRSLCGLLGVATNFYAVSYLVLADSSMLNNLSAFFVTIFAFIFLKEKISKYQVLALILAFFGALLIIKPEFSLKALPGLSAAASAVLAGGAYTILRYLKGKEEPATIVFYFSFVSVIGTLPFLIMNFKTPSIVQFSYLIGIGIFAAIGQFMITLAYRNAPASETALYSSFKIIFSIFIGFIIWGELPDYLSILGGTIITAVVIFSYLYNKKEEAKLLYNN